MRAITTKFETTEFAGLCESRERARPTTETFT
jgi:hypothetical protein